MPVTKRFEVNEYLEDFEEIDEYSPSFVPNYFEEEEFFMEEKTTPTIPFWKKWWAILKPIFSKF